MTYNVQLSPHAVKAYKKLDPPLKPQIATGLDALREEPLGGAKVKRLKGRLRDYYRYRVGDHRIIDTVDQRAHTVYVDYIQHRKDVYRSVE